MAAGRLLRFVQHVEGALGKGYAEPQLLDAVREALHGLVAHDDWLPDAFAQPSAQRYQQYLLYGDPCDRFSVVSFVWGPGQKTPIHDHTVWGAIGMLRGAERAQAYAATAAGMTTVGPPTLLKPGDVDLVSPDLGDVHEVANALPDTVSISIHVYGGNIGRIRRHVFDGPTGQPRDFVSGYSSEVVPNLWSSAGA